MELYEIYINGSLVESCDLKGVAFIKFASARLLGNASLFYIIETGDPVTAGRFQYDFNHGEWVYKGPVVPPCPSDATDCKYKKPYETLMPQRNALRVEFFAPAPRCGWSLKEGRIGGRSDDYHVCRKP